MGDSRPFWCQLSAVAELKVSANPEAQLLHYLQPTLHYRPDFSFVMGLASRLRGFTIYRLSAVSATVNPPRLQEPYSWTKKNTPHLQKYIAAIYHTEEARYNDMAFGLENRMILTLVKETTKWEIFPFHCGGYPSRGTWIGAAVEVGEASQSAIRIAKLYWADVRARWEEGSLYEKAYARGVIPGLARAVQHWKTGKTTLMREVASPEECESTPVLPPLHSPEPVPAVEEQRCRLQRSQQTREQYCVIIGTRGKSLNNCETALHILRAMFDCSSVSVNASFHFRSAQRSQPTELCVSKTSFIEISAGAMCWLIQFTTQNRPTLEGAKTGGTGIAPAFCTPPFFG